MRPALGRQYLSWLRQPLDADVMHRAAQALVGEQAFSAFRTVHCPAPPARRDLQPITVSRDGQYVHVHRKRVVSGQSLPVRVDLGGERRIQKEQHTGPTYK